MTFSKSRKFDEFVWVPAKKGIGWDMIRDHRCRKCGAFAHFLRSSVLIADVRGIR